VSPSGSSSTRNRRRQRPTGIETRTRRPTETDNGSQLDKSPCLPSVLHRTREHRYGECHRLTCNERQTYCCRYSHTLDVQRFPLTRVFASLVNKSISNRTREFACRSVSNKVSARVEQRAERPVARARNPCRLSLKKSEFIGFSASYRQFGFVPLEITFTQQRLETTIGCLQTVFN
jgi:hypothetical protein